MIRIYHNPRCSKSRETLALVEKIAEQDHLQLQVIDYQKTALDLAQLKALLEMFGDSEIQTLLRSNESIYTDLNLAQADTASALAAIVAHPHLLQRPIVTYQNQAAIGRPPEHVLTLFKKA